MNVSWGLSTDWKAQPQHTCDYDHKMGLLPWRKDFDHLNMVSHHRNMRISSKQFEDVMQSNNGEHHHRAGAPVELQPQGEPFPNPVGIQGL